MRATLRLFLLVYAATTLVNAFAQKVPVIKKKSDTGNRVSNELASSVPVDTIRFQEKLYMAFTVNPAQCNIEIFNRRYDRPGSVHDFGTIHFLKANTNQTLLFAMNAGAFGENHLPTGLLVQDGKVTSPIDRSREGPGGFYVQPNGFFALDARGNPAIFKTQDYDKVADRIHLATQSGPLMVFAGAFNSSFSQESSNTQVRNAVGISRDREVIFVISLNEVNFYEFSQLFRDVLGCQYALYLDGIVSQAFIPAYQKVPRNGAKLGPIFAVSLPTD